MKNTMIDDTKEFQDAVVALGREMFTKEHNERNVLYMWQALNFVIQQWMEANNFKLEDKK